MRLSSKFGLGSIYLGVRLSRANKSMRREPDARRLIPWHVAVATELDYQHLYLVLILRKFYTSITSIITTLAKHNSKLKRSLRNPSCEWSCIFFSSIW